MRVKTEKGGLPLSGPAAVFLSYARKQNLPPLNLTGARNVLPLTMDSEMQIYGPFSQFLSISQTAGYLFIAQ